MNKKRLLKLADLLEADAKNKKGIKFDYWATANLADPKEPISCGTSACAMGLAALSGPLHGTASQSMADLVERAKAQGAEAAVSAYLRQGSALPCFGHKLYPDGDVRAAALMASFDVPAVFVELAETGERLSGEKPNVDFALSALVAAFDLPADAPLQIFALARSVGWLAHALEQIETGALIRPRARYVGPAPS